MHVLLFDDQVNERYHQLIEEAAHERWATHYLKLARARRKAERAASRLRAVLEERVEPTVYEEATGLDTVPASATSRMSELERVAA